jgi:hypothetical protein
LKLSFQNYRKPLRDASQASNCQKQSAIQGTVDKADFLWPLQLDNFQLQGGMESQIESLIIHATRERLCIWLFTLNK